MPKSHSFLARTALALALTLATASAALAGTNTYEIDKAHSSIVFKVRHLLGKVPGQFNAFSGSVTIDPDKRDSVNVTASIDVSSINTDEKKRDDHLRSPDFFDVTKFPTITFTGGKLSDVNTDRTKGKLEGTLTIRGIAKSVVLDVEWYGTATDPFGNHKAAFAGTTKLNRKDFGIIWNKTLDSGGYLVGDDVEVEINVEAQLPKTAK
jgi:polyisoprenoid-binding protein YceI